MFRSPLLVALLVLPVAGCGSDSTGPSGEIALGTITARIDGEMFQSIVAFARPCTLCEMIGAEEGIEISGLDSRGNGVGFGLVGFGGEGLYEFDENGRAGAVTTPDGESYETDWAGGSGSVRVTRSTGDAIEGTFSFTAVAGPGGPSVRVTEGRFNLPFQQGP